MLECKKSFLKSVALVVQQRKNEIPEKNAAQVKLVTRKSAFSNESTWKTVVKRPKGFFGKKEQELLSFIEKKIKKKISQS